MSQQQGNRYDAIVIGGGHNGLVAAALLACTAWGWLASPDSPWAA